MMKRYLLPALLLSLAACSEDKSGPTPAPVLPTPTSLIVGDWDYKTARIVTTNDQNPRLNTDVTNTLVNRKAVFTANTATYITQGISALPLTYSITGSALTFSYQGAVTNTQEIEQLVEKRMVLIRRQEGGAGIHEVMTDTYTKP